MVRKKEIKPIPEVIKSDIEIIIKELLAKSDGNIKRILLFGSFAKDTWQPDSDIDIAVVLKELPPMSKRSYYRRIDVIMTRDVDMLFCTDEQLAKNIMVYKHINEDGVVIYEEL